MLGIMESWNFLFDFPWKEILSAVLTFLYSIAHYAGILIVYLLSSVLPTAKAPTNLADPIGYLALLTVFVVIVQVARKLAWAIVVVGWALILVRIIIGLFGF